MALVVKKKKKNPPADVRDIRDSGLIFGSGGSPGGGYGIPPEHSCLENPMDRGAWGLQSMGSQRVGHDPSDSMYAHVQSYY